MEILDRLVAGVDDIGLGNAFAELVNLVSPSELTETYRHIASMLTDEARQRVARLAPLWMAFLRRDGAAYSRETLFEGVQLYRSATWGAPRPCFVCFTGSQFGMFMANARFLDLLGGYPLDVVILANATGTFGDWSLRGARGFRESLAVLTAALAERGLAPGAYIGISAGGGPAVIAALLDSRACGVMFGGRFYRPGRAIPLSRAGTAFEPLCACWGRPRPPIYSIFSAGVAIDVENNQRLLGLMPHVKAYAVPNSTQHSPLAALNARQKLRETLDLVVRAALGETVSFDLATAP